jgi:hypothetical protein
MDSFLGGGGGVRKIGWENHYNFIVTKLYHKYSFHPIMNERNKVICVLCTQKCFVNSNKSLYDHPRGLEVTVSDY